MNSMNKSGGKKNHAVKQSSTQNSSGVSTVQRKSVPSDVKESRGTPKPKGGITCSYCNQSGHGTYCENKSVAYKHKKFCEFNPELSDVATECVQFCEENKRGRNIIAFELLKQFFSKKGEKINPHIERAFLCCPVKIAEYEATMNKPLFSPKE